MRLRRTFCVYFLHHYEFRTGNTPMRLATAVRPNLSLNADVLRAGLRPRSGPPIS